jgi:hypothetical protein
MAEREETEIERLACRLADAELNYRIAYEKFGDGHIETGRRWDKMQHVGDAIRDYKPQEQYLFGCQLRGPGECLKEGKCMSASCVNYGKDIRS